MTQTDYTCNKDARIADNGSNLGSGTSPGLPYGTYSGYKYRTLLGFSVNMAGWTSITSAILWYKSSNQINIAFGSDPTFLAQRITGGWSEGSSSGLSGSNAVVYPGPAVTTANQVQEDAPTGENTWGSVDVTAMMRDVLAGGAFNGIRIIGSTNASVESASSANVGEIYSRESGSGTAYLRINYETNRAPNAPTISSPDVADGGLVGTQTPTLNVNMTDPDGNAINNYHWQVDDNADFSSPIQDIYGGAAGASGVTVPVIPAALPRGGTYYFRVQAADVTVWGGWSLTFSFKVASLPALTMSEPSAAGRLARLTYSAGAGWGSPRMVVNWAMTCPDGGSQASWRLELYNDSAGAPAGLIEDITVGDTQSSRVIPYNLIEGNYYHVRVWATCSHGLTASVGFYRVRARWGLAIYSADMGAAAIGSLTLASLDVTDESSGGQGRVVVEYQTTTAPGTPLAWSSSIGGAGLNRYFYYRVWLLAWGATPAVSPTLNQLNITYTTAIIVPDKWAVSDANNVVGDVSSYVYGTKSLRMKGTGGWLLAHQQIAVVPDTNYVISGRIQTSGPVTVAYVALATNNTGGGDVVQATVDNTKAIAFESPASRVVSGIWNSGNNTSIWVRLSSFAPVGTSVWFDAIKAEASTVVTPWSPGYVANAVVLDAGGLQIDATQGGIFRLRASDGLARSIVELGSRGLKFGGDDKELYTSRPAALELNEGNDFFVSGIAGSGGSGSSAGYWWKAASGTLPYQYAGFNGTGIAMETGVYSPDRQATAIVSINIYQGNPMGSPPSVSVRANVSGEFNPDDFRVLITAANASVSTWEFWVRSPWAYFTPTFKWLALDGYSPQFQVTLYPGGALVPAAPTGVQVTFGTHWQGAGSGSAWPGSVNAYARFWHTAYNMEFYWDPVFGRWLSTQLFEMFIPYPEATVLSAAGSTILKNFIPIPTPGGIGAGLTSAFISFQVVYNVAGPLSASNWWSFQINYTPNDNFVGYLEAKSGSSGWRREGNTRAPLWVPPASTNLYAFVGKAGAAPNLNIGGYMSTYRASST